MHYHGDKLNDRARRELTDRAALVKPIVRPLCAPADPWGLDTFLPVIGLLPPRKRESLWENCGVRGCRARTRAVHNPACPNRSLVDAVFTADQGFSSIFYFYQFLAATRRATRTGLGRRFDRYPAESDFKRIVGTVLVRQ